MSMRTIDAEVHAYVEAVIAALHDLPDDERRELADDLQQHLLEVAAEGDGSLRDRLGSPEEYARELRSTVQLPDESAGALRRFAKRVERSPVARAAIAFTRSDAARRIGAAVPQVQPAWWLVRGYLAVSMMAVAANHGYTPWFLERATVVDAFFPYAFGSRLAGVVAGVAAAWVSWVIGRRAADGAITKTVSLAVSVAAIALTYNAISTVGNAMIPSGDSERSGYLEHADGSPIHNICPYAADGTSLSGVLLFDQNGRAIRNVAGREFAEGEPYPTTTAIENAYPQPMRVVDDVTGVSQAVKCPSLTVAGPAATPGAKATQQTTKKAP